MRFFHSHSSTILCHSDYPVSQLSVLEAGGNSGTNDPRTASRLHESSNGLVTRELN